MTEVTAVLISDDVVDLFDHDGPWTEEEFLAMPVDRRIELLDGELLVTAAPRRPHQRLSMRFSAALDAVAPPEFEVLKTINVRVGLGRIFIPDIVVCTNPGADLAVTDAADVAMLVEIMSRGGARMDRAVKPLLYAAAGIGHFIRVEVDESGPTAIVYRLRRRRYVEVRRVAPGQRLRMDEPFPIDVDLAALAARRPPG